MHSAKAASGLITRASALAAMPLLMLFFILPMPTTIAGPADDVLDLQLLGVSTARLGVLYDFNTRQFLPETLWPDTMINSSRIVTPMPHSDFKIIAGNSINKKLWGLNVHASLAIDVLDGLVKVSGSGQYIGVEKKSSRHEAVTYRDTRTDRYEQLAMERLKEPKYTENIPKKGKTTQVDATHVVVGILYGATACFTFQNKVEEFQDSRVIFGELLLKVTKFPAFSIEAHARLNLTEEQKNEVRNYSVQFNGDYALREIPDSYESALKVYGELGQYFVPVPIAVTLYPLKKLGKDTDDVIAEITANLIDQVKRKFQEIQDLMEDLRGLYDDLVHKTQKVVEVFSSYKEKLDFFGQLLSSFKINFQLRLKTALPEARRTNNMTLLNQLLKNISNSPFKYGSLKGWLDAKRAEFNVLKKYLKPLEDIHLADDQRLVEFSTDFRRRTRVSLELKVETAAKHDTFLQKMENYLADVRELQRRTRKSRKVREAAEPLQTFELSRPKRQNEAEDTATHDEPNVAPETIQPVLVPAGSDPAVDKDCPKENENEYRPSKRETWFQEPNLQGRMRLRAGQLINFWKANQENKEHFLFFAHGGHVNVSDESDTPDCHLTMYHQEEAFYNTSLLSHPQNISRVVQDDMNPIAIVLKEPKTVNISWDSPEHIPDGDREAIQFIFYNRSSIIAGNKTLNESERGFTKRFVGSDKSINIVFQDHLNESIEVMVQAVGDFGFSATTEVLRVFYGKQRYCGVLDEAFTQKEYHGNVLGIASEHILAEEKEALYFYSFSDFHVVMNTTMPSDSQGDVDKPVDIIDYGNKTVYLLTPHNYKIFKFNGTGKVEEVVPLVAKGDIAWQFIRNASIPSSDISVLCKTCQDSNKSRHAFEIINYHPNGTPNLSTIELPEGGSLGTTSATKRHQAAYTPRTAANFKYLEGPRLYFVARERLPERLQVIYNASAAQPSVNHIWHPNVPDPYAEVDRERLNVNLFTNLARYEKGDNYEAVMKTYSSIEVDELGNILILRTVLVKATQLGTDCRSYPELLLFDAVGTFVANLSLALPDATIQKIQCVEFETFESKPESEFTTQTHSFYTKNGSIILVTKQDQTHSYNQVYKLQYLDIVYQ